MKLNIDEVKQTTRLDFLAKQMVEGFITGMHKSPYHGFSVEFAEHRLYNAGESTRHIDWKVFAKTDRLYTKQYEEETNLRCQLVVDCSMSMHYPVHNKGKLTYSILMAASLAYLLHKQRDAVGLTTFSDSIKLTTPVKSTATHLNKLFTELQLQLESEDTAKETSVGKILHEIAERSSRRSLIVIFSDMFDNSSKQDEIFKALQHLKHKNHEVLVFHVADKLTEYQFEFEDRPYEFIDLETGEKIKLQPNEVKDHYLAQAQKQYSELKMRCSQLRVDLIDVDINQNHEDVFNAYMIKRSKMK